MQRARARYHLSWIGVAALAFLALTLQGCTATARSASRPVALNAGIALNTVSAPMFSLRDQTGATVTLDQMHGHIVVLTFLDATCTAECPITAQYLDWTAQFLGNDARRVDWLAMSVNPTNTAVQAKKFMSENSVRVPLRILLGSATELAPLWKAYHIVVQPAPDGDIQHTLGLYVIDAGGQEREWVDGGYDPKALGADIEALIHASA